MGDLLNYCRKGALGFVVPVWCIPLIVIQYIPGLYSNAFILGWLFGGVFMIVVLTIAVIVQLDYTRKNHHGLD